MKKYRYTLDLQQFSEGMGTVETGVESASAAEMHTETPQVETSSETGANPEVAAEPEKQNNFEKAFAKRLAAEREKWQSETAEKYKDYDTHKELSEYLQQINGADAMSLKERIEMERLQERAEKNDISPEMQKRLEVLEQKAAKADQLEQQQHEEQRVQSYFNTLGEFVKDKGMESEKLNQFMIDNDLTYDPNNPEKSFTIAYKAMKADELEQKLASAKEDGIKEYLASKQAPRVEGGNGAAGMQQLAPAKTMQEAEQRAIERLRAANNPT